ncbi:DUF5605 domain-containing protein [Sinomonas sp.]|uniref:DUF5605 domain-containing protein n=1 Tax=Sinomonas sp. TaxID=1914986 RepID=UPI003F80DB81
MTASLSRRSRLDAVLAHRGGRALLQTCLPGITNSPMLLQFGALPVEEIIGMNSALADDPGRLAEVWERLESLQPDPSADGSHEEWPAPADDYEPLGAPAPFVHAPEVPRWGRFELEIAGPRHGNPFTDVELTATFSLEEGLAGDESEVRVGGFYDGDGAYRLRFMPRLEGEWAFVTHSNAASLDGLHGTFHCGPAAPEAHGPVRVADTFHFAYEDGTRYLPVGTTAYAWTHQPDELQERTLETLAGSPFNKLRMCVFPKSYLFNTNEPELFPYERGADGWHFARFNPDYFRKLERRIDQLAALGVEADLILFHGYDRWGFADMGAQADDAFVRYVVRRLSAFSNVWWSLANEYDLMRSKTEDDWERLARIVTDNDPTDHLTSIHNCFGFYDYSREWITHASVQRIDVYRTAENTDEWRERWSKPVVIDECAYEGDIDQGWGNITGEEMVRRFWEGAVRGGYVGHGETYLNDAEELWWSKGGRLVGDSPDRIAFLAEIMAQMPDGVIDPLASDWDAPRGGSAGRCEIVYFGFNRPRYRTLVVPPGASCTVDVIDTWNMRIHRLDGVRRGIFRVELPGRQYMAVRLTFQ